jgi:dihydropyrimidinase
MKADLVLKNGLVCTENGLVRGGLAIKGGVIQAIASDEMLPEADSVYDAKGKLIFPGVVEPHAHLGLQDLTRESFSRDLETETKAAAQGGITTINTTTLFGSNPLTELLDWALDGIDSAYTDVKFYTGPGSDAHIDEFPAMFERGVNAFKFLLAYRGAGAQMFGMAEGGIDTAYMYKAFSKVAELGAPAFAMIHAEDPAIFEYLTPTVMQQKTNNLIDAFHKARPNICEPIDLCKAAYIANEVGCPLYQVHISAKETVDQLRYFKDKGFNVTGETCLHYLLYACDDEIFVDNEDLCKFAKVNPALHESTDRDRLWEGINEGVIECIGTDHVSYTREKKLASDFWTTTAGVGDGYSVLLPLMFSEGVTKGRITLDTLRKILCENPAKVFGLYPQKGTLAVGADADVVIIDPDKEYVIDYKDSESFNEFSIYQGWKVKGFPIATFSKGNLVAENYKIVAKEPKGKLLTKGLGVKIK